MKKSSSLAVFFAALSLLLVSPETLRAEESGPTENILGVIKSNRDLSKFYQLIVSAKAEEAISAPGKMITVFAPSNAAIEKIPDSILKDAKNQPDGLKKLVMNHVVPSFAMYTGLVGGRTSEPSSVTGDILKVDARNNQMLVNTAKVIKQDVGATNGVVHIVNEALIPVSLDPVAQKKAKQAEEEELKRREKKYLQSIGKLPADDAQPAAAGTAAQPAAAATAAQPAKTEPAKAKEEKKGFLKSLFGK